MAASLRNAEKGYIRIYRATLNHPLFAGRPDRLGAWVWLLSRVAWKDTRQDVLGQTVVIKRGQASVSFREMSEAWGWSISAVQRFVTRLKTDTMIDTATDTGRMIITICNYDKYQSDQTETDTPTDTPTDTRPIRDRYTKEEGKKERRKKEKSAPDAFQVLTRAVSDDLAREFLAYRKAKRAPLTRRAAEGVIRNLTAIQRQHGRTVTDWLEYVMQRGWQTAELDWIKPLPPGGGKQANDRLADKIARFSSPSPEECGTSADSVVSGEDRDTEGTLIPLQSIAGSRRHGNR